MSTTTVTGGQKVAKMKVSKKGEPVTPDAEGKVEGVLVSQVKHEMVDANLKAYGLLTTGSLPERIQRLVIHVREITPKEDLGDCSACKGDSNVDERVMPVCPYCGVGGVTDAPVMVSALVSIPAVVAEHPVADEVTSSPEPASKPAKGAKVEPVKKTALVTQTPAADSAIQVFTVADLDAALAAIEAAKKAEVGSYWDHGQAIYRIFRDKLYLQRRKGDKPLYETWGAFAEAELGMSGGNAYRHMNVAANFDRATAILIGVSKLNAVLKIEDPEKRVKLLDGAESLTKEAFEEKVAKVVEKEQAGKTADRGRLTPAQKERNAKGTAKMVENAKAPLNVATPAGEEKVTAALVLGKTKIPLFVKGSKAGDADAKRAKRLADGPLGFEETVNGVRTTYTIVTDAKGALVLVAERKRV